MLHFDLFHMTFFEILLQGFVEFDFLLRVFSEAFFEAAELNLCGEIIVREWRVAFPRKSYFVPFATVAAGVLKCLKGLFVMCRQNIFLRWFNSYFSSIPVVFQHVGGGWLWWWFFGSEEKQVLRGGRFVSGGVTELASNCPVEFRSNTGRTVVRSSNPL